MENDFTFKKYLKTRIKLKLKTHELNLINFKIINRLLSIFKLKILNENLCLLLWLMLTVSNLCLLFVHSLHCMEQNSYHHPRSSFFVIYVVFIVLSLLSMFCVL